ncbi:hypothetical protein ACFW04_002698 [Cataglyphis niger]
MRTLKCLCICASSNCSLEKIYGMYGQCSSIFLSTIMCNHVTVTSTTTTSTNTVYPTINDMDWFAGVAEEELLHYTSVGNDVDSLWAVIGNFVPPPPRPPFLPEESIATDGLTTCDLCSWAWRNDRHSFSRKTVDGTLGHNVWSWLGSRRGGGTPGVVTTPLSLPQHRRAMNLPVENHYTHMQTDEALYAELDSQAASYASDLQLQMRGSSTYGTTSGGQDDEYHELDAARLHRHYGGSDGSLQTDTLRTRHSKRIREPDYEMYENGPTTPVPPGQHQQHHHHHHHHNHHHHHHQELRIGSRNSEHPSYQNTAYTGSDAEPDGPTLSSAPSSAYYSDLSSNSVNQQMPSTAVSSATTTTTMTNLHLNPQNLDAPQYRLAAINENTVPSDYI